jgi:hypothetical protein
VRETHPRVVTVPDGFIIPERISDNPNRLENGRECRRSQRCARGCVPYFVIIIRGDTLDGVVGVGGVIENVSQAL